MDIILRLVIITVLMLMVIGVLIRPNPWRWTLCFVATAFGISGFVLDNAVTDILTSRSWFINVAIFAAKTTVITVWLLVQCIFDEGFRFDRFRLTVTLGWIAVVIMDMWRFKMGLNGPLDYTSLIFALILMGHLIWGLIRGYEDDLRLRRRTARMWLSFLMVGFLIFELLVDVVMGTGWRPDTFIYTQNSLILFIVLALLAVTVRLDISALAPTQPKDIPKHQDSGHAAILNQIMSTEQLYLRPDLRLADVVARLPLSEAATRNLIHDEFGQGHFRSFLNQYRVRHAQGLLRSPDHHSSKLIAIAFDSGFASLASFQRAFKRETGVTASQWRAKKKP